MTGLVFFLVFASVAGWNLFINECRRAARERVRYEHEVEYLTSRMQFLAARARAVTRQLSQVYGGDVHQEGNRVN